MAYQAQDYSSILGMQGISDMTLQNHFKLYQGYVTNTNTLLDKTTQLLDEGKERMPEFAEMRRRLGFEFDGMRLHEYYFENLKGSGQPDTGSLIYQQIEKDFGSFDRWHKDFTGTAAMRGVGWAILFYDTRADRLLNEWIELHMTNVFVGVQPLLVVDCWEHAFYLDYQTERAKYLDAVMSNVKWEEIVRRFEANSEVQQRKKAA
ncbi:MAG TPA: Fe-Mn family superoxide dismutase [Armatimonadota bacterium]|jgi:Fe-Mn family superoxide dismutase